MTPEIHENFKRMQMYAEILEPSLRLIDVEFLKQFEDESRIWANGTMSPIMAHDMGVRDLQRSEANLTHAIKVSQKMRELVALLTTERPDNAG